jgi:type IV fimbrial biogenesis protein FimT
VFLNMQRTQGFSLIELIITIAIMTILITVAIPGFQSTLMRMNASSIADTLIASLNFARSEAISRNERVALCASLDGLACDATAADWNAGWLIFRPAASVGLGTIRYKRVEANDANIELGGNNARTIIFKSSGEGFFSLPSPIVGATFAFTTQITGCDNPQLNVRRVISVALSGNITVVREACN